MRYEVKEIEKLNCVIRYPKDFEEGKKYPVIMFFHGAGGRGDNINVLKDNPYFKITDMHDNFPFITVAPQCNAETWFDLFEKMKNLIENIYEKDFTDKKRFYAMGVSMGGYATWQIAISMPKYFAAIVPICGGGMYWDAARLKNVPVWAFHGAKDSCVFLEESQKMVDAVNYNNGYAKLTVYPENEHNSWSDTYANPEVFAWLLKNENKNEKELLNKFKGSEIYG